MAGAGQTRRNPGWIWITAAMLATAPVWPWYVRRFLDPTEGVPGTVALATAVLLTAVVARRGHAPGPGPVALVLPALGLLAYAAAVVFAGWQVRGALTLTVLVLLVSRFFLGRAFDLGLFGLAMMTLPLAGSLPFYFGYPLRLLTGELTAPLIRLSGHEVSLVGTGLLYGGQTVWIDAPCSGVKMLWTAGFVVCSLSVLWRLSVSRTLLAGLLALALVVLGNAFRTSSLFYAEAGLFQMPAWTHEAVGILVFAVTAGLIYQSTARLRRRCT